MQNSVPCNSSRAISVIDHFTPLQRKLYVKRPIQKSINKSIINIPLPISNVQSDSNSSINSYYMNEANFGNTNNNCVNSCVKEDPAIKQTSIKKVSIEKSHQK